MPGAEVAFEYRVFGTPLAGRVGTPQGPARAPHLSVGFLLHHSQGLCWFLTLRDLQFLCYISLISVSPAASNTDTVSLLLDQFGDSTRHCLPTSFVFFPIWAEG